MLAVQIAALLAIPPLCPPLTEHLIALAHLCLISMATAAKDRLLEIDATHKQGNVFNAIPASPSPVRAPLHSCCTASWPRLRRGARPVGLDSLVQNQATVSVTAICDL